MDWFNLSQSPVAYYRASKGLVGLCALQNARLAATRVFRVAQAGVMDLLVTTDTTSTQTISAPVSIFLFNNKQQTLVLVSCKLHCSKLPRRLI